MGVFNDYYWTPPTGYINPLEGIDTSYNWKPDLSESTPSISGLADRFLNPTNIGVSILNNASKTPPVPEEGFGTALLNGVKNEFLKSPISTIGGFANGIFNLWQGFNQYNLQKNALNAAKDAYNFQKQMALNAERRNQEQWDMVKRQRASSSL